MEINCNRDYENADTLKSTAILSCEVMSSCSSNLNRESGKRVKIAFLNRSVPLLWANLFFAIVLLSAEVGNRVVLPLWVDSANGTVTGATMNPYFALSFSSIVFFIIFGLGTMFIRVFSPKDIGDTEERFPHLLLFLVGFCDALNGVLILFACKGSRTPPYLQAILGNFLIPLTVLFRFLILRKKPTSSKLQCAVVVAAGLFICLIPTIFPTVGGKNKAEPLNENGTISRIMWPIIFMLGCVPEALMRVLEERGVKIESDKSGEQMNLVHFLFWTSTYELLCIVALFWTDILPWYGHVDGIKNFGKSWWSALQCFFGAAGCSEAPGLRGTLYIATHIISHIAGANLLRHAEGATLLAIVTSLVTPLGFIFWTLFREIPFEWYPEVRASTWFSIGALVIMLPAIFAYNMGAPEISLTPDGSNREELFCSTQSRVERELSRTGPEEPLLSDSNRQPRYSAFEA